MHGIRYTTDSLTTAATSTIAAGDAVAAAAGRGGAICVCEVSTTTCRVNLCSKYAKPPVKVSRFSRFY